MQGFRKWLFESEIPVVSNLIRLPDGDLAFKIEDNPVKVPFNSVKLYSGQDVFKIDNNWLLRIPKFLHKKLFQNIPTGPEPKPEGGIGIRCNTQKSLSHEKDYMWFHRAIKKDFQIPGVEEVAQFLQDEKDMQWYIDNLAYLDPMQKKSYRELENEFKKIRVRFKDQDFSSSIDVAKDFGSLVFSIKLPKKVYFNYLQPGMGGRGVGVKISIPGYHLHHLIANYQYQICPVDKALQKFSIK